MLEHATPITHPGRLKQNQTKKYSDYADYQESGPTVISSRSSTFQTSTLGFLKDMDSGVIKIKIAERVEYI